AAAAEAVMADSGELQSSVIEGIAALVSKSLVTFDGSPSAGRWRLLETIRAFALAKLTQAHEVDAVARRSVEHLRDMFGPPMSASEGQASPGLASSYREIDNVRAAIDWAFSASGDLLPGLELVANSSPLWFHLSLMVEYGELLERALERLLAMPDTHEDLEM